MSVLRRAYEAVILLFLTPIGTLIWFGGVAAILAVWGVDSPTLWWIAAAVAAPFLVLDTYVFLWSRRSSMSFREIARTITQAMWSGRGHA